jgi:hypothetical protein
VWQRLAQSSRDHACATGQFKNPQSFSSRQTAYQIGRVRLEQHWAETTIVKTWNRARELARIAHRHASPTPKA